MTTLHNPYVFTVYELFGLETRIHQLISKSSVLYRIATQSFNPKQYIIFETSYCIDTGSTPGILCFPVIAHITELTDKRLASLTSSYPARGL